MARRGFCPPADSLHAGKRHFGRLCISFTEPHVQPDAVSGQTSSLWTAWTGAKIPEVTEADRSDDKWKQKQRRMIMTQLLFGLKQLEVSSSSSMRNYCSDNQRRRRWTVNVHTLELKQAQPQRR